MASDSGIRYHKRQKIINNFAEYSNILDARNRFGIEQYTTPKTEKINYFELEALDKIHHMWTYGDRFYKLAHRYYDNSTVWWIIALLNHKPTESHCILGQEIIIYMPLRDVLIHLGVY